MTELANERKVYQKASGWKLYHMATQLDEVVRTEALPRACRLYLIVFYYHINLAQSLQHIWSLHHTPSELMTSKVATLVHTRLCIETLALINGHYSSPELQLFTSTPSVCLVSPHMSNGDL